jgi:site-specific DNA-methyltransferase (adenine-specific)
MENIKLHNGDCMVGMKNIANKSIDMIACDLPYNMTANHWDQGLNLDDLFKEYMRVIKDTGAIALFGCQPFTTDLIVAGRKWFRYEIIWNKNFGTDFFNANRKPLRTHENILIFYKKQPTYNPQKWMGKPYKRSLSTEYGFIMPSTGTKFERINEYNNTGEHYPRTIVTIERERKTQGLHTTQKPIALIEWLIKTYTNEGDIVMDNTMGSGTAAVACINLKRRFIGWELDQDIFKVAEKRVNDLFSKMDDEEQIHKKNDVLNDCDVNTTDL